MLSKTLKNALVVTSSLLVHSFTTNDHSIRPRLVVGVVDVKTFGKL